MDEINKVNKNVTFYKRCFCSCLIHFVWPNVRGTASVNDFTDELRKLCVVFDPLRPFMSSHKVEVSYRFNSL